MKNLLQALKDIDETYHGENVHLGQKAHDQNQCRHAIGISTNGKR